VAFDEALAERVRAQLSGDPAVTEKAMFGTRAFLVDGHLALAVGPGGLMVRVGEDAMGGERPATMGGREMKGWVLVTPGSDEDLADWVARGTAYARSR